MRRKTNMKNMKKIFFGVLFLVALTFVTFGNYGQLKNSDETIVYNVTASTPNDDEFIYLSDIDYISKQSGTGWGNILKDKASNGSKISVKIEGAYYTFDKGMWAHATSTLVYDISNYDYEYFTAYVGLNSSAASSSNGVKFYIYTSVDGKNWDLKTSENPNVLKAGSNAELVKINIKGAKYLKLYAHDNGSNGNDHSVYADAKLTNNINEENVVSSLSYYDNLIKTKYINQEMNDEYELVLLQREFVRRAGQYAINHFAKESDQNKDFLNWLLNDLETLRLYIMGGTPDGGSYYNSLTQLKRLYEAYKDDFAITEKLNNKWYPDMTKGDLYKKMAVSLSLTHSTAVGYWAQINHPSNRSDALERYRIFKYLHDNGKFVVSSRQDQTPWFEALHVEEMRYVMNSIIDDEEIIWFNEYTQKRIDAHPKQEEKYLQPHTYIAYVWPNFENPIYHDPANYEYWDTLFEGIFSKYGVTYSTANDKVYKAWMSMRNKYNTGAVCGGISKLGTHIRAAHGTPASVISQPGHAAIIYYRKDDQGRGYWTMDNGINSWGESGKTERLSIRMPLGWGNDSYVSGWAASYIVLSQEALNHYDELEEAEKLIMISRVFDNDPAKKEQYLRKALKIQSYNIDAWWELIKLYQADNTKTEADYFKLAEEVAENLKAFPLPMYNLTNVLKNHLKSTEYTFAFSLLQGRILTEGSVATAQTVDVYQPSITREVAKFLLGQVDTNLATFSFDGEDAGKIVLSKRFDGNGIRWDYSLDGKKTWKEVSFSADEEHKWALTKKEIESISDENDIYVHIVGANYSDENLFKLDVKPSAGLPSNLYANDLENKIIGSVGSMQWRYSEEDDWTFYKDQEPDLTGNKSVMVKAGATGLYLASTETKTYQFTEDNQPDNRKYISISHLSIHSVSSEATGQGRYAKNAIDGNINTNWHSAWNGSDKEKYIVIKLDEPKYLTALEFYPVNGGNGKIRNAIISVSMDGENWTEVVSGTNWAYNMTTKSVDFEPTKAQYIKIVGKETQAASSSLSFIAANMFNLYEKVTPSEIPTTKIEYSTKDLTKEDVVATLIYPTDKLIITNNNGKNTYTFKENGSFTFEFEDKAGNTGTATAKVDWIDKEVPTATLEYSTTKKTNQDVVVTLIPNEKVTVLNNQYRDDNIKEPEIGEEENSAKNDPFTYTFTKNGSFTFEFKDEAGNVGTATATVTWIDKEAPTVELIYSTIEKTSNPVSVTLKNPSEKIKILSNEGKDTYVFTENGSFTFKFEDEAGNVGTATATVTWIDNEKPTATFTYDIKTLTNRNVTAIINFEKPGTKVTNNKGSKSYTFTENGSFTFEFEDEVGNIGTATAMVDWIDKIAPTATISYSKTTETNQPVTVTLTEASEDITITNNKGKNTYTFTENGSFTFEFEDEAGNIGTATATVDWIKQNSEVQKPEEKPNQPEENKPSGNENNNPSNSGNTSNTGNTNHNNNTINTDNTNKGNNNEGTTNNSVVNNNQNLEKPNTLPDKNKDEETNEKTSILDDLIYRLLYKTDYDNIDYAIVGGIALSMFIVIILLSKRKHVVYKEKK